MQVFERSKFRIRFPRYLKYNAIINSTLFINPNLTSDIGSKIGLLKNSLIIIRRHIYHVQADGLCMVEDRDT